MSQKERDRLQVLHEASKGQLTQKAAAAQLRVSERQLRRLVRKLRHQGDTAVVYGFPVNLTPGRLLPTACVRPSHQLGRETARR